MTFSETLLRTPGAGPTEIAVSSLADLSDVLDAFNRALGSTDDGLPYAMIWQTVDDMTFDALRQASEEWRAQNPSSPTPVWTYQHVETLITHYREGLELEYLSPHEPPTHQALRISLYRRHSYNEVARYPHMPAPVKEFLDDGDDPPDDSMDD